MFRKTFAVAVGLACAVGVLLLATSLTAFSMDGPRDIEVPFGLGLLIAVVAAWVGLAAWALLRRR